MPIVPDRNKNSNHAASAAACAAAWMTIHAVNSAEAAVIHFTAPYILTDSASIEPSQEKHLHAFPSAK